MQSSLCFPNANNQADLLFALGDRKLLVQLLMILLQNSYFA